MLAGLVFTAPWALAGLATLPVLWWLLRVTPPAPRTERFPAIRLLAGLVAPHETPARTPPFIADFMQPSGGQVHVVVGRDHRLVGKGFGVCETVGIQSGGCVHGVFLVGPATGPGSLAP